MITETIFYVGADITDKHKFENQYVIPHGMAYNSYIIIGEKIALLDTIDIDATEQWLLNIQSVLNGRQPDYLIVHHMEPDHSANIRTVMDMYPNMQMVASAKALTMIEQFFEDSTYEGRFVTVKDGDEIDLGDRSLKFYTAPFIHWPEVIVTYDTKDKVLFSADAFGKFGALQYEDEWLPEARRYYCNIVGKYGTQVQTLFKKLADVDFKVICPLHGPVLKDNLAPYIEAYQHWSTYTPEIDGVLVVYASIYGGTRKAALELADKISLKGQKVVTIDLCNDDQSEAIAQAFRMSKVVFASVTYDSFLFPAMYDFIHHLQMKNWQNRRVAIIENGTWAPIAAKIMTEMLSKLKNVEIVSPTLSLRSTLHKDDLVTMDSLITNLLA